MQNETREQRPKRARIDWEPIKKEYEHSVLSASAIAEKYGVSSPSLVVTAKRKGWQRLAPEFVAHSNMLPAIGLKLKADGTQLTEVPIADDIEALTAMRHRIIGQHKIDISRDAAYLNELEKAILEKKSAPLQKLNALQTIVKIRGQLIELERQAHAIAAGPEPKGQTNVQINVSISPQDAYRQLIEGGGGS